MSDGGTPSDGGTLTLYIITDFSGCENYLKPPNQKIKKDSNSRYIEELPGVDLFYGPVRSLPSFDCSSTGFWTSSTPLLQTACKYEHRNNNTILAFTGYYLVQQTINIV